MFKFNPSPEVLRPVTIHVPVDGGGVEPFDVKVRFKLLDDEEINERNRELLEMLNAQADRSEGIATMLAKLSSEELEKRKKTLMESITGWEDIADHEGNPLPFSEANLAALLKKHYIHAAFAGEHLEASKGAPVKNLKTPPPTGQAADQQ